MPAARLPTRISLASEDQTRRFASALAPLLASGDTVALWGDLGAGKSLTARSIIQTRLAEFGKTENIPSPTYTLVQIYEAGGVEIWHSDLFRLSGPEDADELGLQEAFDTAICLIEWPDRIAEELPAETLHLKLEPGRRHTERVLTLTWESGDWDRRLATLLRPAAAAHG